MRYLIYGLIDPRDKQLRYVGRSCSGFKRIGRHFREHSGNSYKERWIRQLVARRLKPNICVIQKFEEPDLLNQAEQFWISYFRKLGCPLTNLTDGGGGMQGYKGKKRPDLSARNRENCGKALSVERRLRISASLKGKSKPFGFGQKVARANSNRVWTQNSRIKTSRSLGGREFMSSSGQTFSTIREAAKILGLQESNVRHVLKGRLNHTGSYSFVYV